MTAAPKNSPMVDANLADARRGLGGLPALPDERFWKRYSPHHEASISFVSSGFGHIAFILIFGALGFLATAWGWNRTQTINFMAVQLGADGGNPDRKGNAPGVGPDAKEDAQQNAKDDGPALSESAPLKPDEIKRVRDAFDNDRVIMSQLPTNDNIARLARNLEKDMIERLRDGLRDGHAGSKGPSGPGPGGKKPTERERRMLRWTMVFETSDPNDYVDQLAGLGAILAIPAGRDNEYRVIRDLRQRPAQPQAEDVAKLNRIYWIDEDRRSVAGVMRVLGVPAVAHFVAFMPQDLEARLFEKELKFKGLKEDQIDATKFKVVTSSSGYDVEVKSQTTKKK